MDQLRIGLVGTSGWAEFAYLSRLAGHPGAAITTICGRDQVRAAAMAEQFHIPRIESDWRQMLDKGGIDALIVAVPDDLHKDIVLAAAAHQLPVLCEKPLANSAADAWAMQRAAAEAGIPTMVQYTWRWQPHFVFLNDLLKRGELGRPLRAQLSFISGFGRAPAYSWRTDPRRSNGTFADLGSHMIDLARLFFGDPQAVTARLGTAIDRSGVPGLEALPINDNGRALLHYANGPEVLVEASAAAPIADRFMTHVLRLETTTVSVALDHHFAGADAGVHLSISDGTGPYRPLPVPAAYYGASNPADPFDIYGKESVGVRLFADCLLAGRAPTPDLTDGAKAQDIIDAALRSSAEGRTIDL